MNDLILL